MRRLLAALVCVGGWMGSGVGDAHAFGWYRKHGDYVVAARGCYHFRSPRWNYAAAYYQTYARSYGRYRGHAHKCRCR